VTLTHLLREAPAGRRWEHTVCVLGAERLGADVLDRLTDACEASRTGLIIGYRTIPGHVKERLGRGNAAVAFMRLGNAQDARVASEQIGAEHRFVISQLTDTVGMSVTDTAGDSYTSTVGDSGSVTDSASVTDTEGSGASRGRSRQDPFAPFGAATRSRGEESSRSRATSDSVSITEGISSSTAWGISTSQAVAASSSSARTAQRSRELLVEPHELQQLPPSAVIVTYAAPDGRRVVLADANPGIIALGTSTPLSLEEAVEAAGRHGEPGRGPGTGAGTEASTGTSQAGPQEPPPNLGPPPERLDWRRPPR